jgi:hypothetical protein
MPRLRAIGEQAKSIFELLLDRISCLNIVLRNKDPNLKEIIYSLGREDETRTAHPQ